MGFDWSEITSGGSFVTQGVSGLMNGVASTALVPTVTDNTLKFGILSGGNQFYGLLSALQKNQMVKVLAEPNLVAVSGRPARFQAGGKVPYPMPAALGQPPGIQFQEYGTQIDFVPIVLGHGNIHLEVRPSVSELDFSNSLTIAGTTVPALRTRYADTAVELKVGQTLALAGLIQARTESTSTGLPWLKDLPYLGVPFRRVRENKVDVELLILVRPELAEGMDCDEVPPLGPGEYSRSPTDCELYCEGHIEVPAHVRPGGAGMMLAPNEQLPAGRSLPSEGRELPPGPAADRNSGPGVGDGAMRRPGPMPTLASPPSQGQLTVQGAAAPPSQSATATASRDNSYSRSSGQTRQNQPPTNPESGPPGFIGPVGRDVRN
jgi:pilus assembly protein CpaC